MKCFRTLIIEGWLSRVRLPPCSSPFRGDQVTMTAPFMRAYTERLVHVCHKHGAHAIGGMSAFIPSRKDAAVNAAAMDKARCPCFARSRLRLLRSRWWTLS